MRRRVRVHAAAAEEMTEAAQWYEARHAGLGGDFLDAVAATLERIDTTPELGVPTSQDRRTRRLLLARFPFHLVYRVAPAELVVIAVAHTKRRPGYWKARR